MKVSARLTHADLQEAVVEYLGSRGFRTVSKNVTFNYDRGDREGPESYTASAECEAQDYKAPVYRDFKASEGPGS